MASQHKTLLCQYHYDPLDQLTGHTQSESLELQRFYCKTRMATEIQGTTRRSIFQHGDLLLAQQCQGEARDATLLATDQQRSVLHTLKANNQPHPIAYSPYGHRPSGSGLTSLLGFNGERPDPVTGHYLLGNGYRAFNPVLMRFNSPDSLSPFGKGGMNAYIYCMGDPVNLQDPNGHAPQSILNFLAKIFGKRSSQATPPLTTPATSASTSHISENPITERDRSKSIPSLRTQPRHDATLKFARTKTDIYAVDRELLNVEKIERFKNDIKELELNVIPKNRLLEERYLRETKAYNAAYRDLSERAVHRGDKYEVAPPSYESVQRKDMLYTFRDWTSMQEKKLLTLKEQLNTLRNG